MIILFLSATIIVGGIVFYIQSRQGYLLSPVSWISVIMIVYAGILPLAALLIDNTELFSIEHRHFLVKGSIACQLYYVAFLGGYFMVFRQSFSLPKLKPVPEKWLRFSGRGLFIVGGICYISYLSVWSSNNIFKSYLLSGINLFLPSIGLLWIVNRKKVIGRVWTSILTFLTIFVFVQDGFRYRLLYLVVLILLITISTYKIKINVWGWLTIAPLFLISMGVIKQIRQYHKGIDVGKFSNINWMLRLPKQFVENGFGETSTFLATSMIIEEIPKHEGYVGWSPLYEALVSPVPRSLWEDKPTGNHLNQFYRLYLPQNEIKPIKLAFLLPGGLFLMAGWFGVLMGGCILGLLAALFFAFFCENGGHAFSIVLYGLFLGWMFFVFTRGYFPQHLIQFAFLILPIASLISIHYLLTPN